VNTDKDCVLSSASKHECYPGPGYTCAATDSLKKGLYALTDGDLNDLRAHLLSEPEEMSDDKEAKEVFVKLLGYAFNYSSLSEGAKRALWKPSYLQSLEEVQATLIGMTKHPNSETQEVLDKILEETKEMIEKTETCIEESMESAKWRREMALEALEPCHFKDGIEIPDHSCERCQFTDEVY
jgi:hypothetical protein